MAEFYPDMDLMNWTEDLVIDYLHHLIKEYTSLFSEKRTYLFSGNILFS